MSLRQEALKTSAEQKQQAREAATARRAAQVRAWETKATETFGVPVIYTGSRDVSIAEWRRDGFSGSRRVCVKRPMDTFRMDDVSLVLVHGQHSEWHLLDNDEGSGGLFVGPHLSRPFNPADDEERRARTVENVARALGEKSEHPSVGASGSVCPTCHEVRS